MNQMLISMLAATVFMSPGGDDKADGSKEHPVKSLERALSIVRSVEREEEHEIVAADGFYEFLKPVMLTANDYDITIRAEHSRKAVFSGAALITGWKECEDDPRLLEAPLPFEPQAGSTYTMISKGEAVRLARYPETGTAKYDTDRSNAQAITPGKGELPEGALSDADLESVLVVVPQEYSATMSRVIEYDARTGQMGLARALGFDPKTFNHGFYILNARCGMTGPGSWMYEVANRRVLYWPKEGESADGLACSIARTYGIIGDRGSHGIRLEGLVFEGCIKTPPVEGKEEPLTTSMIAAVRPDHWTVKDCEFRASAGTGMFLVSAQFTEVDGCYAHDLGSNGIDFYDGGHRSVIRNCEITRVGQTLPASFGIGFQITQSECISNQIHHVPGNGIVAWATLCTFASNDFHHCMQSMADGGGLYGGLTMCTLKDNYVHDTRWAGLYVDEGSFRDLYVGNVFENVGMPIHVHNSQYVTVSNNVFRGADMYFSFQGSGHCRFERNRIYTTKRITETKDLASCDFWGNNEQFVKEGAEYRSLGDLSFPRMRVEPYTITVTNLDEEPDPKKKPAGRSSFGLGVNEEGYLSIGVPSVRATVAFNQHYLFIDITRAWNVLASYPGWKNFDSTGWQHCDALKFVFENGAELTVFPDGRWESTDKDGLKLKNDDISMKEGVGHIQIPLVALGIKGAKKGRIKLDLDKKEDSLLLTEEATDEMAGPRKKMPKSQNVVGCEMKFNALVWIEDMREVKSVFPKKGDVWATGTLKFGEKKPESAEGGKGKKKGKKAKPELEI